MISMEYLNSLCTEEYMKFLGKRLKYARKRYSFYNPEDKLTQVKMANYLHIERQRIINIENGKVPINYMELVYYSKICGFRIDEFLFYEDSFFFNPEKNQEHYNYPQDLDDDPL